MNDWASHIIRHMKEHIGDIVIHATEIQGAIDRLAEQLIEAYGPNGFTALVLLEGARRFWDDLAKRLAGKLPVDVRYLRAQSYHGGTRSSGAVQVEGDCGDLHDKAVVLVDDIYDTGRTLHHLQRYLQNKGVRDLKLCILLEKQCGHEYTIELDYVGLAVADVFLVGYGLDYQGKLRELNHIHVFQP